MQTGGLYDEVISVLRAEFECAESLQATSAEMQSLIDAEKLQQVQERLISRGEIIDLLASLDHKLSALLDRRESESEISEWDEVLDLAGELRELITSVVSMDQVSRAKLEANCEEINRKLNELHDGRKIVSHYGRYFKDNSHPLYNA